MGSTDVVEIIDPEGGRRARRSVVGGNEPSGECKGARNRASDGAAAARARHRAVVVAAGRARSSACHRLDSLSTCDASGQTHHSQSRVGLRGARQRSRFVERAAIDKTGIPTRRHALVGRAATIVILVRTSGIVTPHVSRICLNAGSLSIAVCTYCFFALLLPHPMAALARGRPRVNHWIPVGRVWAGRTRFSESEHADFEHDDRG